MRAVLSNPAHTIELHVFESVRRVQQNITNEGRVKNGWKAAFLLRQHKMPEI